MMYEPGSLTLIGRLQRLLTAIDCAGSSAALQALGMTVIDWIRVNPNAGRVSERYHKAYATYWPMRKGISK